MALYREKPKCIFCGADIAEAVHADKGENFIGDIFERWRYKDHQCDGMKKWREKNADKIQSLKNALDKTIEEKKRKS